MNKNLTAINIYVHISKAFDCLNHDILLSKLRYYGLNDDALSLLKNYLTSRDQYVQLGNIKSECHAISCGIRQGSVMGPLLFNVYLQCDITDDAIKGTINRLEKCIADVSAWMKKKSLKINEDKTEFIIFHRNKELIRSYSLQVGDNSILPSNSTKILDVSFDQKMTLNQHITNTCKSAYFQIRRINSIRQYLTDNAVKTLTQSIVISRLDYCNSVCIGLPMKSIHRLQLAQNAAARVVKRTPKREHMTPVLRDLHWLPMIKRVQFKILLLVFKSLHCEAPSYVCDLLNWYHPNRHLRSANTTSLVPNRNETITFGKRLMDTASASLWNFLPDEIKCAPNIMIFKAHLKDYCFILPPNAHNYAFTVYNVIFSSAKDNSDAFFVVFFCLFSLLN